jgi:hypothetical protein
MINKLKQKGQESTSKTKEKIKEKPTFKRSAKEVRKKIIKKAFVPKPRLSVSLPLPVSEVITAPKPAKKDLKAARAALMKKHAKEGPPKRIVITPATKLSKMSVRKRGPRDGSRDVTSPRKFGMLDGSLSAKQPAQKASPLESDDEVMPPERSFAEPPAVRRPPKRGPDFEYRPAVKPKKRITIKPRVHKKKTIKGEGKSNESYEYLLF